MNQGSCVIGYGVIGKAIANAFSITDYFSRHERNILFSDLAKYQYIHICLPTPTINGKCFTDDITKLLKDICKDERSKDCIFIIHSTTFPGYNKFLQKYLGIKNIVSNPEFLSEDTAIQDANNPSLIVIGGDDPKSREKILGLYRGRFKYSKPIVTDSITAELIKWTLNAFFTTKVVFGNAIYDYAQIIGANYETVKLALQSHPWGSKNHFTPFHKGGKGAGGKCLPKDIEAFANASVSTFLTSVSVNNKLLLKTSQKS